MRHRCPDDVQVREATSFEQQVKGPWISVACNHCFSPSCVSVCPTGAMHKREDNGIVVHNADICIGCRSCIMACPYGHPKYIESTGVILKCDMCAARLDQGDVPACVEACPVKVLTVGTVEENEAAGGKPQGVGFTIEETNPSTRFIPVS